MKVEKTTSSSPTGLSGRDRPGVTLRAAAAAAGGAQQALGFD
jgi:hypothetical protein